MTDFRMGSSRITARLAAIAAAAALLSSCVDKDNTLGESYIPTNQKFEIHTCEFELDDIKMQQTDSLSCYSLYRFTVGAIRDELFGLTTRETAFTLVPIADQLDFGRAGTQVFRQFHFSAPLDTISTEKPSQAGILQNIYVYELEKALDLSAIAPKVSRGRTRITDGLPVYNGRDSLSFDFSRAFGEKYMTILSSDLDTLPDYTKKFPGIYIKTGEPVGEGGRINMFKLPVNITDGYIYGPTAELKFSATYDSRGQIDTSFLFYLGPVQLYNFDGVTATTVNSYPQIAYDITTHSSKDLEGPASDVVYFEGGKGIKPVISAASIREKLLAETGKYASTGVVINRASLLLPFEFPEDYTLIEQYPTIMSPTVRIVSDEEDITFAGITDASVSSENQGNINRSLCRYEPDITLHTQMILGLKDESEIGNYDIWLLPMRGETITESSSASSSSNEMAEYYQQLAYYSYYNNMYGSGYGYNSYYNNNYYNYMMLAQMYSSQASTTTSSSQTLMDTHRFYKAVLNGPSASGEKPRMKVIYSVPVE